MSLQTQIKTKAEGLEKNLILGGKGRAAPEEGHSAFFDKKDIKEYLCIFCNYIEIIIILYV